MNENKNKTRARVEETPSEAVVMFVDGTSLRQRSARLQPEPAVEELSLAHGESPGGAPKFRTGGPSWSVILPDDYGEPNCL